jgi:hypothetical protein
MTATAIQDVTAIPAIPAGLSELDERSFDGLVVRLLWSAATNEIFVQRIDLRASDEAGIETFHLVPSERAREGFDHPIHFPTIVLRSQI